MFRLVDQYGAVLAGRQQAADAREKIEREVADGHDVVVDLQGIVTMSPSFADELFGKLPVSVGESRVTFEHLSEHIAAIAEMVAARRRTTSS